MTDKSEQYESPHLQIWGTVEEITAVGNTNVGTDIRDGSVNPPGHDQKGGRSG